MTTIILLGQTCVSRRQRRERTTRASTKLEKYHNTLLETFDIIILCWWPLMVIIPPIFVILIITIFKAPCTKMERVVIKRLLLHLLVEEIVINSSYSWWDLRSMNVAASQPSLKWEETTPEVHTLYKVRVIIIIVTINIIIHIYFIMTTIKVIGVKSLEVYNTSEEQY